jgi:hypothetical protein
MVDKIRLFRLIVLSILIFLVLDGIFVGSSILRPLDLGAGAKEAYAHDFPAASSDECGSDHTFELGAPPAAPGYGICRDSSSGGGTSGAPDLGKITIKVPELGTIVKNIYLLALFAAAVFFLIQFAIGGIAWIGAGGDPKNLDAARNRLTNAVIGLVIVVAAFGVTTIVTGALGINIFTGEAINILPTGP